MKKVIITVTASLAMLAASSSPAWATTHRNPVCTPLEHTIRYWLPRLHHAPAGSPRWTEAAVAVDDYVNPDLGQFNRWIFEIGNSWYAEGQGLNFSRPLKDGLRHINEACQQLVS